MTGGNTNHYTTTDLLTSIQTRRYPKNENIEAFQQPRNATLNVCVSVSVSVCVRVCVCVCSCLCACRLHVRTEGVWHTFVVSSGEPADTIFKCRHDFQNCRNRRVDCKFGLSVARRVSGDVRSRHLGHRMRGTRLNVK